MKIDSTGLGGCSEWDFLADTQTLPKMADPISVISLVEGSIGLVLQCGLVVKTLSDLRAKFKYAEIAIMSLIQEVETIQFAWSRIKEWSEDHAEAATDTQFVQRLEKSLQCGTLVLSALEQDLADYKDVADNASFLSRSKMAWNERAFLDHQHRVRGQVQAMTLMLQVSQLSTSKAQTKLLKKKEKAFRASDESAYSIVPSRMSSRMSVSTRSRDSLLSIESRELVYYPLSFEDDLFTARVYKRNYRNLWVNSLSKIQWGKKREGGRVSAANLEASEDGPSLQSSASGMTTPTAMSVDLSQPYPINEEISLRDLRPVPPSPAFTAATKADPTSHERSLMIAGSVPSTLEESPSISTGLQNGAMESSIKPIHPPEWQFTMSGAISSAPDQIPQMEIESNVEVARTSPIPEAQYDLNHSLLLAVEEENLDDIRTFIDRGAQVNPYNDVDRPPLHLAVFKRNVSMTKLLLQKGANCAQKWQGMPSIHQACEYADIQIVRLLLDAGASVSSLDALHKQPLHKVLSTRVPSDDAFELVDLLISRGADVNSSDQDGCTCLHVSCKYPNVGHVRALLTSGADPKSIANHGSTALHFLVKNVGYLVYNWGDCLAISRLLLKHGAEINAENKDGDTPFHLLTKKMSQYIYVSWCIYFDIFNILLGHGANLNAKNRSGDTPLHDLAKGESFCPERKDAIQLLLEHGVNVNAQNSSGDTPLHILAKRGPKGNTDVTIYEFVFRSLIEHGAQVNRKNMAGDTPLHIFARRGHSVKKHAGWMDGIRWLLDAHADIFVKNFMHETPWQLLGQSNDGRSLRTEIQARFPRKSMS